MKIGRDRKKTTNPGKNNSKKNMLLILLILAAVGSIAWVYTLGKKAEDTISVVMWAEPIYKNEVITENSMVEYKMLKAEYEKYAVENENGSSVLRCIPWDRREEIMGLFAAYPLQKDTLAMNSDLIKTRVDNKDTVLYSFPGKDIVKMDLGEEDLETFKTYIQPGDRVNITALVSGEEKLKDSEIKEGEEDTINVFRTSEVFTDILLADLLNGSGESVLDLYTYYNDLTVQQQAALDDSESWKERTTPQSLIVALTPEEKARYYKFLATGMATFKMSLPQRTE